MMNRTEIAHIVAAELGIAKRVGEAAVDAAFGAITRALAAGEAVRVFGFGDFKVTPQGPKKGRNPHTGERIEIAARRAVRFKPSAALRRVANGEHDEAA